MQNRFKLSRTPSTEITEEAAKFLDIYCEWSPNEKTAVETAYGASMGGARAFAAMKHVGLNVAKRPAFHPFVHWRKRRTCNLRC